MWQVVSGIARSVADADGAHDELGLACRIGAGRDRRGQAAHQGLPVVDGEIGAHSAGVARALEERFGEYFSNFRVGRAGEKLRIEVE